MAMLLAATEDKKMSKSLKGPWSETQIDDFLRESVFPLRLASTAADGYPRVVAVWFYYEQGKFFCVSHRDSQLVALLRANAKVGFEVSPNQPPYCGVRGQGIVTLLEEGNANGNSISQLIPLLVGRIITNPKFAFHATTTPQKGLDHRQLPVILGRGLGGSEERRGRCP